MSLGKLIATIWLTGRANGQQKMNWESGREREHDSYVKTVECQSLLWCCHDVSGNHIPNSRSLAARLELHREWWYLVTWQRHLVKEGQSWAPPGVPWTHTTTTPGVSCIHAVFT